MYNNISNSNALISQEMKAKDNLIDQLKQQIKLNNDLNI